jgi:hypothetical protein
MEKNKFNTAMLKKQIDDLKFTILSQTDEIASLKKDNHKLSIDATMSFIDLYAKIKSLKDTTNSLTKDNIEEVITVLIKTIDATLGYIFPNEDAFIEMRDSFTKIFGKDSVHTKSDTENVTTNITEK